MTKKKSNITKKVTVKEVSNKSETQDPSVVTGKSTPFVKDQGKDTLVNNNDPKVRIDIEGLISEIRAASRTQCKKCVYLLGGVACTKSTCDVISTLRACISDIQSTFTRN